MLETGVLTLNSKHFARTDKFVFQQMDLDTYTDTPLPNMPGTASLPTPLLLDLLLLCSQGISFSFFSLLFLLLRQTTLVLLRGSLG